MVFHHVMHACSDVSYNIKGVGHIGAHAHHDFVFSSTPYSYSLHSGHLLWVMSGLVAHLFTQAKLN